MQRNQYIYTNMERLYTLPEDSNRLIAGGLSPETSDGWVNERNDFESRKSPTSIARSWSVAKLLDLMPPFIRVGKDDYGFTHWKCAVNTEDGLEIQEGISYHSETAELRGDFVGFSTITENCTFLECCVKMMCWINSQHKIGIEAALNI